MSFPPHDLYTLPTLPTHLHKNTNIQKPGKPEELRFLSTYINNGAANAAFQWHRPRDAPGNGWPSCITEYRIEVLAVSLADCAPRSSSTFKLCLAVCSG